LVLERAQGGVPLTRPEAAASSLSSE
jgi:hypothetical protein